MPDFYQTGTVTTLHRLGQLNTARPEREQEEFSQAVPIASAEVAMDVDLMRPFFRRIASEGIKLSQGLFEPRQFAYTRQAEVTLPTYGTDTVMNGVFFQRHEDETSVATFGRSIREAAQQHVEDPLFWPLIPNWNRIESALPTFLEGLKAVVHSDNDL